MKPLRFLTVFIVIVALISGVGVVKHKKSAEVTLLQVIKNGKYTSKKKKETLNFKKTVYVLKDGTTVKYKDLINPKCLKKDEPLFTKKYDDLKSGSRMDFLSDVFKLAKLKVADDGKLDAKLSELELKIKQETKTGLDNLSSWLE